MDKCQKAAQIVMSIATLIVAVLKFVIEILKKVTPLARKRLLFLDHLSWPPNCGSLYRGTRVFEAHRVLLIHYTPETRKYASLMDSVSGRPVLPVHENLS